jgi:hypothetical protein
VVPFDDECDPAEPLGLPYGDPVPLAEFAQWFREARDQTAKFIRHQDPFEGVLFTPARQQFVPVGTAYRWTPWHHEQLNREKKAQDTTGAGGEQVRTRTTLLRRRFAKKSSGTSRRITRPASTG